MLSIGDIVIFGSKEDGKYCFRIGQILGFTTKFITLREFNTNKIIKRNSKLVMKYSPFVRTNIKSEHLDAFGNEIKVGGPIAYLIENPFGGLQEIGYGIVLGFTSKFVEISLGDNKTRRLPNKCIALN